MRSLAGTTSSTVPTMILSWHHQSGALSDVEHAAFIQFIVEGIRDLYQRNRYAPYVVTFQNWLKQAGVSFDHLHKQLFAIDERGRQANTELSRLRQNPIMYNEWAVDYAGYHNLVIAENEHAVAFGIWPPLPHPGYLLEVRDTGAVASTPRGKPSDERSHPYLPRHEMIKWRVSTSAGFEGGTKIYLNRLSPQDIRDHAVKELYRLRDMGWTDENLRIATECSDERNSLKYNPLL